jgi:hypothetical protein
MGLQSRKSPNFGNFKTPKLGSPKTKWLLGVNLVAKHKEYYKGGRWWLPSNLGRGESYEFVYACGSFTHQKCFNHALINLLFGLCKFVWIIDSLITHPSPHPTALARPFTPKMLWVREHTLTLLLPLFPLLDSPTNLSRNVRVRHHNS